MPKSPDVLETIVRTLADVRALERYLVEVVELQQHEPELRCFPEVMHVLDDIVTTASSHVARLDRQIAALGATGDPVRQCTAAMAGAFLGFITKLRSHEASKILRDDCTLLNLLLVKYQMLHTTAASLAHRDVAAAADAMGAELVPIIEEARRILPNVLVKELSRTFVGIEPAPLRTRDPEPAVVTPLAGALQAVG
jgi:hypothetical protein